MTVLANALMSQSFQSIGWLRYLLNLKDDAEDIGKSPQLWVYGKLFREVFNTPIAKKAAIAVAVTRLTARLNERISEFQAGQADIRRHASGEFCSAKNASPQAEIFTVLLQGIDLAGRAALVANTVFRFADLFTSTGDREMEAIFLNFKTLLDDRTPLVIDWTWIEQLPLPPAIKIGSSEVEQIKAFIATNQLFSPKESKKLLISNNPIPNCSFPLSDLIESEVVS